VGRRLKLVLPDSWDRYRAQPWMQEWRVTSRQLADIKPVVIWS